jgi:TetR/AcrR family transcriptional repressor of nem operon
MSQSDKNPVGRPREFDEDKVLDAALDIFWLQGYESTSMADLLKVTGLHKGSLYQAFGDKHNLFVQALRRYMDGFRQDMQVRIDAAKSGMEELHIILDVSIHKGCHGKAGNAGCLALNTLADKGTGDPAILAVLQEGYSLRMQIITTAVARAQTEGSLRADWAPERIAAMVSTMSAGVVTTLRGPVDMEMAQGLVNDFLETVTLTPVQPAAQK